MEHKFYALNEFDEYVQVPFSEVTQAEALEFIKMLTTQYKALESEQRKFSKKMFAFGFMCGFIVAGVLALASFFSWL